MHSSSDFTLFGALLARPKGISVERQGFKWQYCVFLVKIVSAAMGETRKVVPGWIVLVTFVFLAAHVSLAGTLIGSADALNEGADVNLSLAGPLDWVHWGLRSDTSIERKANVAPQISDLTPIRSAHDTNAGVYVFQFSDNLNSYSWSDGIPTLAVDGTTTGVWAYGFPLSVGAGFEIRVPADTSIKTLKVYVGAYGARGRFEAILSDGSAPNYLDTSVSNFRSGPNTVFTLQFAADSPGQTLRICYTAAQLSDPRAGNVTLLAAALNAEGANSPPSVMLTTPTENSNSAHTNSIALAATASDLDGNIEKVEFYAGAQKLGEDDEEPFSFVWDTPFIGHHVLTAVAYDNSGNFAVSVPVDIFVYTSGGSLTGAVSFSPAQVDLTTEGTLDWTHWGTVSSNSFDRKAAVAERISNFTPIGSDPVQHYSNNYTRFSWTDGKPTPSVAQTPTGVFMTGDGNGFELRVPADTLPKRLKVYVGLYGAVGDFRAYLSDMTAPAYTDTSLKNAFGDTYAVYTLDYQSASIGQNLIIQYRAKELYDFDYGNVTLQSATLTGEADTNVIPWVQITSPTNNPIFDAGSDVLIEAEANDPDGSVVRVEFFHGNLSLGEDTTAPYSAVWTNPPAGSYTLTAKVTDNLGAIITSEPVLIDVRMPPPLEVRLANPRFEAGTFNFDISTVPGRNYTIQYTANLLATDWQNWSSFEGDGTVHTITDLPWDTPLFYRAIVQ